MAVAVAEAGTAEEAAAILEDRPRLIDRAFAIPSLAGRTHARNPLPRLGFAV